ncbi:MAG: hypothetical protein E7637_03850 [Ruminococcaceae bacterium]|nr:hypothetical protein [Oscillospiraceae bacterium]
MQKTTLNGTWSYRIGRGEWEKIIVPFSRLPVGHSECFRTFDLEQTAEKIFLQFDGITYGARVTLNGQVLGDLLAYAEYRFDVTELVRPTKNELLVELEDIEPKFGPTEGWENFGGIIRDVSILYAPANYIEDVFFHSTLKNDYVDAEMTVETKASEGRGTFAVSLYEEDSLIHSYTQKAGDTQVQTVSNVKLWSPDTPNLYRLEVALYDGEDLLDSYTCMVGFREISHDRHRFLVNGKPLFFKGVCKHEMVGDSGHCPTEEQIESDLRLIKKMGCNFVRLVHYPHHKKTVEIADRLGLMVSEEPGLWWSDTSDPDVAGGSIEVLKRTIMRDRNHASIAFWLSFNECRFTEKYLVDSANTCRAYDPTRMVSGANCMSDEDTLIYYNKCGFDFYTMHPYSRSFDRAKTSAEILHDKPLVFTEWGGYHVYGNPHFLRDYMEQMNDLYQANSDEGALAGGFLWYFAALNDFNRGSNKRREHFCVDGVLCESLVDKYRNPTLIYETFCEGLKLFDGEPEKPPFFLEADEGYEVLDPSTRMDAEGGADFAALFEQVKEDALQVPLSMRKRKLKTGPVAENVPFLYGTPKVISKDAAVVLTGKGSTDKITLIGMTAFPGGYPLRGSVYGEALVQVEIAYADGTTDVRTLKNGEDITTAYGLNFSSRINPIAKNAARFATFGRDKNFDVYLMNRLELAVNPEKTVKTVRLVALGDTPILLYGAFV